MKMNHEDLTEQVTLLKKIGAFGFLFFLFKGLVWLALITYFGIELS
jgi:hypothetical protein